MESLKEMSARGWARAVVPDWAVAQCGKGLHSMHMLPEVWVPFQTHKLAFLLAPCLDYRVKIALLDGRMAQQVKALTWDCGCTLRYLALEVNLINSDTCLVYLHCECRVGKQIM